MSGARIWPSAATLELGIPLLVPFSEGGGGVMVKGGDLGDRIRCSNGDVRRTAE